MAYMNFRPNLPYLMTHGGKRQLGKHFTFSNFSFFENRALYDNVEKYGGAREAANGNMAVRCMLD